MDDERLVDEMAVALCGMTHIADETVCMLRLMECGFRALDIATHFDEAMALARLTHAQQWAHKVMKHG